ncbi:MAG: PulJ/GspJ family protein [Candidatus Dormibacteraceae bacterium]
MKRGLRGYAKSQGGYTLIEVIISVAIGAILMAGLSSVILTSVRASGVATSRLEASNQVRSFQFLAYDDFAHSGLSGLGGCTQAAPCATQPITLTGTQVNSAGQPVGTRTVSYTLVSSAVVGPYVLERQVGGGAPAHAATNVSWFSWYLTSGPGLSTVVVSLTITVQAYSESQTFVFYPRVNP